MNRAKVSENMFYLQYFYSSSLVSTKDVSYIHIHMRDSRACDFLIFFPVSCFFSFVGNASFLDEVTANDCACDNQLRVHTVRSYLSCHVMQCNGRGPLQRWLHCAGQSYNEILCLSKRYSAQDITLVYITFNGNSTVHWCTSVRN
jgi:hypothetical protein